MGSLPSKNPIQLRCHLTTKQVEKQESDGTCSISILSVGQILQQLIKIQQVMLFPSDYPLVIAAALGMNWQTWAFGLQVGRFRHETFNQDFMTKEWGTLHRNQIGEDIPAGGFPDTGSGVYSQRLSYRDWYNFNVLQRIHLNSLEAISLAQTSLLAAGIYRPREAALIGLVYMLGRLLYSIGAKTKKGGASKARMIGFALSTLTILANSGIFLYHLMKHVKK